MIKRIKNKLYIIFLLCFLSANSQQKIVENYNLMPWPNEIKENSNKVIIDENFTVSLNKKNSRVYKAATNFIRRVTNRTGVFIDTGFPLIKNEKATVNVTYNTVASLKIGLDESYTLSVKNNRIQINANTDIGVLRALETVLQLISYNEDSFYVKGAEIKDKPRFVWRGLMIDVSRHFQPVDVLKRNLRAMASVKMNVFHWHLTDDQGVRFESKVYPKLQEIAADGLFYTQEQIKDVVAYAADLGIRVVPEFAVPGHASAILAAYPSLGSKKGYDYSVERFSGVFDPTLNPSKEVTYLFLETLFREIAPLFPDEYFHIGGDENEGKHWDANAEIQAFKKKHKLKTNHDLQTYFNIRIEKVLKSLGKKLMGWDEILTPSLPTTAVIHSWRGKHEGLKRSTLIEAAKKGYQAVLSNGYYIDRMLSVDSHYLVDPIGDEVLTKEERKRVLGAETTMWSELVTPLTIDSRIWPRTAAIAERFWSKKEVKDLKNMRTRLAVVNSHLEELGITHKKNKDVILRNIAKVEDVESIKILTDIFEPIKVYSRNKGGTEYNTFSPFTLFADACSADAVDAYNFNQAVALLTSKPTDKNKEAVKRYFNKWVNGYQNFLEKPLNANTKVLKEHYSKIKDLSVLCLELLKNNKANAKTKGKIKECSAF